MSRYASFFLYFSFLIHIFDLNFYVSSQQNIDADLGRVIAKVSGRAKPTTSTKDAEKKKEKKKDKKQSHEESTSHKDNVTQDPPEGASNAEELKERKKKRNTKKVHSSSTTTIPEDLTSGKQIDPPQGAIHKTTKNPSQKKISGPTNESSNSCLQPPPNKVLFRTFLLYLAIFLSDLFFLTMYLPTLLVLLFSFRCLSLQYLRHLRKITAKKPQLLSMRRKELLMRRYQLLIRLPKAILKKIAKLLLTSKQMTK
jgi:hypothetical protein